MVCTTSVSYTHLNRRVRTVGEQLSNQFAVGLARMSRAIRERMNVRDNEVFTPVSYTHLFPLNY